MPIFEKETETGNEVIERAGIKIIRKGTEVFLEYNGKTIARPPVNKFERDLWVKLDVLIVPFGENLYRARFKGCLSGAIGITYPIATDVFGKNQKDAEHNLYLKYDHISRLTLVKKPNNEYHP
jgi:hypothetical protein